MYQTSPSCKTCININTIRLFSRILYLKLDSQELSKHRLEGSGESHVALVPQQQTCTLQLLEHNIIFPKKFDNLRRNLYL